MHAYNLADLENELDTQGWTVTAHDRVEPQPIPGQVHVGGYTVTLTSPERACFGGYGPTRADALRTAAQAAGLIGADQPTLQ